MRRLYAALLALGTLGAEAAQPPGPAPAPGASVSAAPPAAVPVPEGPQDLAFEKPAGRSARTRHHARFWCSGAVGPDGRPLWLGADTFNLWVGRSYTTGRVTHHIAPDIDRERDTLLADLYRSGRLEQPFLVPHLGWNTGRNGGGDCYHTDGNMAVGVLRRGDCLNLSPPAPPPDESCRQP